MTLLLCYLAGCALLCAVLYMLRIYKLAEEPDARPISAGAFAVLGVVVVAWPVLALTILVACVLDAWGLLDAFNTKDKRGAP